MEHKFLLVAYCCSNMLVYRFAKTGQFKNVNYVKYSCSVDI